MKYYDAEIDAAVKELGVIALGSAKENCPVRTGKLKSSITLDMCEREAVIGTYVKYAPYVELGHGRTAPRGFLAKGAEKAKENAAEVVAGKIREGIS